MKEAERALNERQINMIMQIPPDFTNQIQAGKRLKLFMRLIKPMQV